MKSSVLKQPRTAYVPNFPVPRRPAASSPPSRMQYAALIAKHVIFTVAFVFFCIGTAAGIWYANAMLGGTPYDMVALFLILIIAANVTSSYVVWCIKH